MSGYIVRVAIAVQAARSSEGGEDGSSDSLSKMFGSFKSLLSQSGPLADGGCLYTRQLYLSCI